MAWVVLDTPRPKGWSPAHKSQACEGSSGVFFMPELDIGTPWRSQNVALLDNLSLGSTKYWTIAMAFQLAC